MAFAFSSGGRRCRLYNIFFILLRSYINHLFATIRYLSYRLTVRERCRIWMYFNRLYFPQERLIRRQVRARTTSTLGTWTRNRCANRSDHIWRTVAITMPTNSSTRFSPRCVRCCGPRTQTAPGCWRSSPNSSCATRGWPCGSPRERRSRTNAGSCGISWAPCGCASCSILTVRPSTRASGRRYWTSGRTSTYARLRTPICWHCRPPSTTWVPVQQYCSGLSMHV